MDAAQERSLADRIDRLERQNRRLRLGLTAFGISAVAAALVAAQPADPPELIEAGRVVVRGGDGRSEVSIGVDPRGRAGIAFREGDHQVRVALEVAGNGVPILRFFDARGTKLYQIPR